MIIYLRRSFPKAKFRPYLKPYWSEELKQVHAIMKRKRNVWLQEGRPRGVGYRCYREQKQAKCEFRKMNRHCFNTFLNKINQDIDDASNCDSALFQRLFNAKRARKMLTVGNEMKLKHSVLRNLNDITEAWGKHFAALYSDTDCVQYDKDHFSGYQIQS